MIKGSSIVLKERNHWQLTFSLPIAMLFMFIDFSSTKAQLATFWSEQKKIPVYEIYNNEQPPYLVVDQNHTVYAFNSQFFGEEDTSEAPKAVFYREWTPSNGWSYPNGIMADPDGSIDLLGVSNDESGKVHLIFQKDSQDIYYSQAFLANASDPQNWSAPILVGEKSSPLRSGIPSVAAISTDKIGQKIIIIYSGTQDGNGLYVTHSADYGNIWSDPYPIYLTGDDTMVVSPSLYLDHSGFFHAVWSTFDNKGFGGPGYYAKFDLNSGIWSDPMELDEPGIRTPSVIEYKGDLFIGYYHHRTNGRWWRRSTDGGKTWTDPVQLASQIVGTNGGVSFVIDSNDVLHAFFAGRTDADGNHGMWHLVWRGTIWSQPDPVVKGKDVTDREGGNGFDPTFARAIVSNGNMAFVTWGTDGGVGTNGAWYSYATLSAPELSNVPLPLPTPTLLHDNQLPATSASPPTLAQLPDSLKEQNDIFIKSPQIQLFIGIIPAIVLIIAFIVNVLYGRKKG